MNAQQEIEKLRRRAFKLAAVHGSDGQDAVPYLREQAGVDSLKHLNVESWRALVGKLARRSPVEVMAAPPNVTPRQWQKMMALKKELKWDDATFSRQACRIGKIGHINWLDVPTARKVIAGMVSIQGAKPKAKRQAKPRPRPKTVVVRPVRVEDRP